MELPLGIADTLAPPCRNKNCWSTRYEYPYATWMAGFPERYTEPREYLDFLQAALALAEQEEVFRVVRASLSTEYDYQLYPEQYWEYRARPGRPTYGQYMEQVFNETGEIIFSDQIPSFPGCVGKHLVLAAARLSCYSPDGQLLESEVDNVSALLKQVRPAETEEMPSDWTEEDCRLEIESIDRRRKDGAAIYLLGDQGSSLEKWEKLATWHSLPAADRDPEAKPTLRTAYLGIALYSDIWLPKVWGSDADVACAEAQLGKTGAGRTIPLFDNRELALRHTPRLNRFIQGVRQLVEQRGGSWSFENCEGPELYQSMSNEDGIILDAR